MLNNENNESSWQKDLKKLDLRRIGIFLVIAYGMAIITTVVIYFNGGLANSPHAVLGLSLAALLLMTTYMGAPALANVVTRLVTGEGFKNTWFRPSSKNLWVWALAWVGPVFFTLFGGAVYFLIFPENFDITLPVIRQIFEKTGDPMPFEPMALVIAQLAQALMLAPVLNGLFTLGEEFGWRAYLLQKLMPLGYRKAIIISSIIWGTWHWPIIFIGYNYGFDYFGAPVMGPLLFVWVCFCFATFLSWTTLKNGSVWPAVIGHAAINGIAGFAALFQTGTPEVILGPTVQGLLGSLGFAVVALVLFFRPGPLDAIPAQKAGLEAEPVPPAAGDAA